jgi:hypothetical protein
MSTVQDFQKAAKDLGKDEVDLMAIKNGFIENELVTAEALFVANTETLRVKQDEAAVDQKALAVSQEALKLEQESTKLAKQKEQFTRTGSTQLTGDQTFDLEVQAARDALQLAKDEAEIKKSLIDIEYGLLAERVKVTFAEGEARTKMLADLSTAQTNAKNNVDKAIENAEDKIGLTVMNGFKTGLEQASGGDALGGLRTAIAAATAGEGAGGDGKTGGEAITNTEGINLAKTALEGYRSSLMELGPEGEAVVAFADGALQIADSFNTFTTSMDKADKLKAVGGMIAGVSAMMAANSKMQIAEIDNQIAAEKKRDGKSKESLAKIAALEAKKLAQQKKAFEQNKKMKMAETVINTAAAVVEALPNVFLAAAIGAMGAIQLALIAKTQFQGGGASNVEVPKSTALTIGKRGNSVDVSQRASGSELSYLRGARGVGSARMDNSIVEGTLFAGSSVQHWGNNGTGIYFNTDIVTIQTASSERMRLTSGGDLLLGTTTGGRKLVIGNLNGAVNDQISLLDGGGTEQATISVETTVANDLLVATKASLRIFTGSVIGGITTIPTNERMRLTSGGNVLIGTTTDDGSNKLQVNGNATFGAFVFAERFRTTVAGTASFAAIYMNSDSNSGLFQPSSDNIGFTTAASEAMRITSSQNLLLGTTTDSGVYRLDVFGKARVQSVLELDDVLTLNAISTPADPASGKSSIYMDSADGAIKVKINVGGTVVTRTIASFE